MPDQLLSLALALPTGLSADAAVGIVTMAGRLGFGAVHLAESDTELLGALDRLSDAASPALVVVDVAGDAPGMVRTNDPAAVRAARRELDDAGSSRPLLVAVPVSIGRTMNEAVARADREPRFAGSAHPQHSGIFGTFESAQEQVLALARAGADGLVVDVPLERDVADVLAQVRALVIGPTTRLLGRGDVEKVPAPRTTFYS